MNLSFKKGIKIAVFGNGEKMIESGTLLQDRYLIEKQIGEGGMGAVYVAIDQRFGSQVAIKETFYKDDELGEAFEREARLLNSLHHPVLPHVSDFFAEKNGYFLVMQFIEGEDLHEILKREGAFPLKDVLRWTDDLLDALDYLHSQEPPIIHRDIKPQNLKITARGDVILLDFGLAKLNSEESSGVKSIFGYSRKYSPLEQIQGTGTDARSDIFSLAATAYHLLTGKPAIEVIARASEIIQGNPDPLRLASDIKTEVPVAVANVLNSALALNAVKRFATAKAMRQALEHAVNSISTENTEEIQQPVSAIVAGNFEEINASEIENFTALEAFAADAANNLPETNKIKEAAAIEIPIIAQTPIVNEKPILTSEVYLPEPEPILPENSVVDMTTMVVPNLKQPSRYRVASVAALLVCIVFGALYFIAKPHLSSELKPSAEEQSSAELNSNNQQPVILDEPSTEVVESSILKNTEQAKTKPLSTAKTVEKKATVEKSVTEVEPDENPQPVPPAETPRSTAPPPSRRSESQRREQHTRPRVTVNEPAPDIESIFTGRPSGQRNEIQRRKEERRREREDMSEEEFREMRRQRRQERRQRQNGSTFPF